MRSPRLLAATATLLSLMLLAACGDDDGSESEAGETETVTETASSEPTTDATTTAPTETASVSPMDPTEGSDITVEQVNAALLAPEDIAPGLVQGQWTNDDSPPPCDPDGQPTDVVVPPAVESGTEISTADGNANLTEEIAIYDTEDEAAEAFRVGSAGLDCSSATLTDGTTATIGAPEDVTAQINTSGIGTSTSWSVSAEGYEVVLIATLSGRLLMANTFVVAQGADTTGLPTPLETAQLAFAKALAN